MCFLKLLSVFTKEFPCDNPKYFGEFERSVLPYLKHDIQQYAMKEIHGITKNTNNTVNLTLILTLTVKRHFEHFKRVFK